MYPNTFIVRMKRYDENGQPCCTDFKRKKGKPFSPFIQIEDVIEDIKYRNQKTHHSLNPKTQKTMNRKSQVILFNIFSKSSRSKTSFCSFSIAQSIASLARKILFSMFQLVTNLVWLG